MPRAPGVRGRASPSGMTELAPIALPEEHVVPGLARAARARRRGRRRRSSTAARGWGRGRRASCGSAGRRSWRGYLGDETATAATIDAQGWLHSGDLGALRRGRPPLRRRPAQGAHQVPRLSGGAGPARGRARAAPGRGRRRRRAAPRRGGRRAARWPTSRCARRREPGDDPRVARPRVAPYKRPVEVVVVDEIPRNPTGKLLRRVLVERERERRRPPHRPVGRAPERLRSTPR